MCELDSHADTCCLGKDCLVLYETDKAEVSGFSTQLGKLKETPVITGVLAYDEPETGETYLLYFHQALHLPMMEKSLLNPNQMREAGIIVNDVPLKFIKQEQRTSESHSLVVPINDDNGNTLTIPLELKGVISGFTVRKPSWEEIANVDPANRIEMTNDNPEWAPNDSTEEDVDERRLRQDVCQDMVRTKGSRSLSNRMTKMVRVNSRTVAETSHKRKGTIDPIGLASRWGIGLSIAERTFKATTQLGVRDFSQGVGSKRLKHTAYQFKHSNPGFENRELGRWLGPSKSVGQAMSSKILTRKGKIVHRTSVWPLSVEKSHDPLFTAQREQFDTDLKEALGNRFEGLDPEEGDDPAEEGNDTPFFEAYEDDEQKDTRVPEADDYKVDAYDKLISAKVMLPLGDSKRPGQVIRRKRDADGNPIGRSSSNPYLDTSLYEVEFHDGHVESYAANLIAENIYEQLDDEGNKYKLIDQIMDHRKDATAIPISEGTFFHNGREHKKKTTRGWQLCILWKDGSTSWEMLKDLKESYPLEVAKYAVANLLDKEPAFNWWVDFTLKRRARLIKAVSSTRYMRKWQKYSIELPKTVERALQIDKETGTDFWAKALQLEMSKIFPAVKILEEGAPHPPGHQVIPCHIVFDIKMDFTRKARYVAGGHRTQEPEMPTYASVVSRESVRIGFLLAALNGIDILAADIAGAYLDAPCHERVCTKCGLEIWKRK